MNHQPPSYDKVATYRRMMNALAPEQRLSKLVGDAKKWLGEFENIVAKSNFRYTPHDAWISNVRNVVNSIETYDRQDASALPAEKIRDSIGRLDPMHVTINMNIISDKERNARGVNEELAEKISDEGHDLRIRVHGIGINLDCASKAIESLEKQRRPGAGAQRAT